MRRILTAVIAAAGLVLGLSGAASAHSTDDWYTDRDPHPADRSFGYVGYASSHVGGVYQTVEMWRTDNYVALGGYVSDTVTDGYCGTAQIRYETYENGSWVGHWHYRTMPVYDCTTGSTGAGEWDAYFYSNYKVRNLYSRACHATPTGEIIHCESSWHGPI